MPERDRRVGLTLRKAPFMFKKFQIYRKTDKCAWTSEQLGSCLNVLGTEDHSSLKEHEIQEAMIRSSAKEIANGLTESYVFG